MRKKKDRFLKNIPGLLANRSCRIPFGDSPDVATANACVAAAELIRRRDDRDDVTTTPGKTFLNEPSAALRILWRGDERTSLKRLAENKIKWHKWEKINFDKHTKHENILWCRLICLWI